MPEITQENAEQVLNRVLAENRGPGGVAAILKNGKVVTQRVWGYSDLDQRILMTAETRMPICSITKQLVCMLIFDLERNPTPFMSHGNIWQQLSEELNRILPAELTQDTDLTVQRLCHMQSGIRDYWALSTLWGTRPESVFSVAEDAPKAIPLLKSFHFEPGTEMSYSNVNFYILARIVERVSGQSLGELLKERIFVPAKMKSAELCPDNNNLPPPCIGYEGDEEHGFVPAVNRMQWSGDAGAVASLLDMIAYEQFFDKAWNDSQSLPRSAGDLQKFKNGKPANYGYGLSHDYVNGIDTVGHGGAIRGYRLHRRYMPSERLSIVLMFNHESNAGHATHSIFRQLLSVPEGPKITTFDPNWRGTFFDAKAKLIYEVKTDEVGKVSISGDSIDLVKPDRAESPLVVAKIEKDQLTLDWTWANNTVSAQRITKQLEDVYKRDYTGSYHCAELESTLHIDGEGGMLYGSFDGYLGKGPSKLMRYVGQDIWILADPRGLDAPAPGEWTMLFHTDEKQIATSLVIGCSIATNLEYQKMTTTEQ